MALNGGERDEKTYAWTINLSPASGWRAVFETPTGPVISPLAGWATQKIRTWRTRLVTVDRWEQQAGDDWLAERITWPPSPDVYRRWTVTEQQWYLADETRRIVAAVARRETGEVVAALDLPGLVGIFGPGEPLPGGLMHEAGGQTGPDKHQMSVPADTHHRAQEETHK